jgi:hypothetical protein
MGLFDFLKSNKNIITDNGNNYIYYDNGKGSIKEKFNKINGVINGDYVEFNRNGTFNIRTYIDGVILLTEEEILIKKREEEINKNIKVEISKLKIIDDLISEISGIFLMVQMKNSKIDYYSKLIVDRYNNKLDENYIKFYLYTKRNYFIKQLIEYNLAAAIETGESLNDINVANYYNKRFTEHIVNYSDGYFKFRNKRGIIKVNYSDSYFVKSNILSKLFVNFDVNSKLIINYNGIGINKEIFNQQSVLFGLNLNTYKLIFEIIEKKSNEFKYDIHDKDNIERDEYLLEMLRGDESVINNETTRKPDQMDKYAQKIVNEILSLCINNKVNQNNILL